MANLLGQLLVELGINTAAFKDGLDKATYQAKAFAKEVSAQFSEIGNGISNLAQSFAGLDPAIGGAVQSISNALSGIAGSAGGAAAVVPGLVGAIVAAGAAAIGLAVSASASAARIGELSKATGVSVESLSVLSQVAGTVGLGTDQMGKALERMDKSALAAAQSGPKVSTAYSQLGIAVTDASGAMRSADAIFNDVAKRFAELPDGPEKTALAMKIFGRAGAEMIPLLDKGGEKLAELEGHFKALGATIDGATAESSEELKTNMSLMQAAFTGIENELVKDLVPALNEVATEFISFFEENHDAVIGWAEAFADSGKIVLNIFQGLVGAVKIVRDAFQLLIEEFQAVFGALGNASYDALKGNFKAAWADVKAGAADAANSAKYNWDQAANDIKGSISGISNVWNATLTKPDITPKSSEGPTAKAVDTTFVDKMVQSAERAAQKEQELANAIGLTSQASIEAAAQATANEEIQKLWDEAVDKGVENTSKFLAAWREAIPQLQSAAEWMETFKAAAEDQKGLDTFNEKIKQQIVAMQGAATAQNAVQAAMEKNNASLTPLVDKLEQLKAQYDALTNGGKNVSSQSEALAADIDRESKSLAEAKTNVTALNGALQDKALNEFGQEMKKLADETNAVLGGSGMKQIAAQVDEMTKKFGLSSTQAEALTQALIKLQAATALASTEKKVGFDPDQMRLLVTELSDLQDQWNKGQIGAAAYDKTIADIKAQQADLKAQTGGFIDGISAGFADLAAKVESQGQIMQKLTGSALDGISSDFAAMVTTGKAKWQDLVNSMEQMLLKSELSNLLSGLFSGLQNAFTGGSGGFSGGLLSAFGGGKERGGDVSPGKWYVVGERKPEIFVPHTSGTILPTAAPSAMTGGDTHVQMNIQTSDANSFAKSASQMIRDMTRNVSISSARNRGAY